VTPADASRRRVLSRMDTSGPGQLIAENWNQFRIRKRACRIVRQCAQFFRDCQQQSLHWRLRRQGCMFHHLSRFILSWKVSHFRSLCSRTSGLRHLFHDKFHFVGFFSSLLVEKINRLFARLFKKRLRNPCGDQLAVRHDCGFKVRFTEYDYRIQCCVF